MNPNVSLPGVEKQQTAKEVFREMRATTHSYAKNFAMIGMVFSAVECTIESVCTSTNNKNNKKTQIFVLDEYSLINFVVVSFRVEVNQIGRMAHMLVVSLVDSLVR